MVAGHAVEVAGPLNLEPSGMVGAVNDDVGAVGVSGEDGGVDLLGGDARDGVALSGADEVAGRVIGGFGGFHSGWIR